MKVDQVAIALHESSGGYVLYGDLLNRIGKDEVFVKELLKLNGYIAYRPHNMFSHDLSNAPPKTKLITYYHACGKYAMETAVEEVCIYT